MVMRVQQVDGEYRVVLTPEALVALNLTDGSPVEVLPVVEAQAPSPEIRYLTNDEALNAYRETLPQFRDAYEELAK
jgi:hypothetical protein